MKNNTLVLLSCLLLCTQITRGVCNITKSKIDVTVINNIECDIINSLNASCNGANDASFIAEISNGVAPFDFLLNAVPIEPTELTTGQFEIDNLAPGTYTLLVTDITNCVSICSTVILEEPDVIVCMLVDQVSPSCNGDENGSLSFEILGGTGQYSFTLNGNMESPSQSGDVYSFTGLGDGDYSIEIEDENSCIQTCVEVEINAPDEMECSVIHIQDASCYGTEDGIIRILATGGTGEYSFSLNSTTTNPMDDGAGNFSFINLAAGSYEIEVTDANNCTSICSSITVTQPPVIECEILSFTNATCNGSDDGEFSFQISGGNGNYSFLLNSASATPNILGANSFSFENLAPGTYTVEVIDASDCTMACLPVMIEEPEIILCAPLIIQSASCLGTNDGSIDYFVSGGNGGFTFTLNGNTILPLDLGNGLYRIENLMAGIYNIGIFDINSCIGSCSNISINEPEELSCTFLNSESVSCHGFSDGQFTINVIGGTQGYTFSLNGINTSPQDIQDVNYTFANLTAGAYDVTIIDSNQCETDCATITISEPLELSCSLDEVIEPSCEGFDDGSITLIIQGGSTSYTIRVNGVLESADLVSPNAYQIQNIAAGNYMIEITDENDCFTVCEEIIVSEPVGLACSIEEIVNVSCSGGNDGSVILVIQGGTPNYDFGINGMFVIPNDLGNNQYEFENLESGTFSVTVNDINGCTLNCDAFEITAPPMLDCTLATQENVSCNGGDDGQLGFEILGGILPYQFTLNNSSTTAIQNGNVYSFEGLAAGSYTLQITDNNGCVIICSTETISEPLPITCSLESTEDVLCNGESTGSFVMLVQGGTPNYSFLVNGVSTIADQVNGDMYTFSNMLAGTYTFSIVDQNSCMTSCSTITIQEPSALVCDILSITDISCFDGADGSIEFLVTGGLAPFDFFLNGDLVSANQTQTNIYTISGLTSGEFIIEIEDANNCKIECSQITINAPDAISCEIITINNVSTLGGMNGSFDITISGGTLDYTFEINGSSVNPSNIDGSTFSFSNLGSGMYSLSIIDENECLGFCDEILIDEPLVDIGDFLWLDLNGNGKQELGEPGVEDVSVHLHDSNDNVVESTSTDANGLYFFEDIIAGFYYISFDLPFPMQPTELNAFDDHLDSDIYIENGLVRTHLQNIEEDYFDFDGGVFTCAKIGNIIWLDSNNNDVQDIFENGINGLTVEIYKDNGASNWVLYGVHTTSVQPGTPSTDGWFQFCVPPGLYYLKTQDIPGSVPVALGDGTQPEIDNNIGDFFGPNTTDIIEVFSGDIRLDIDGGFYEDAEISDYVWLDSNANGIQDTGEEGFANLSIDLYDVDGNYVMNTSSDENGYYIFHGLSQAEYYVKIDLPEGYEVTLPNKLDEAYDSDIDNTNGLLTSDFFHTTAGETLETLDIGLIDIMSSSNTIPSSAILFPNPNAQETLNITLDGVLEEEFILMSILDTGGKLIRNQKLNFEDKGNYSLSTKHLMDGTYLLRIEFGNQIIHRKFIMTSK